MVWVSQLERSFSCAEVDFFFVGWVSWRWYCFVNDVVNNIIWGGGGGFKGGTQILEGPKNPDDAMVVVLKDIILCLFGFRFKYIGDISWYYI